MTIFEKPADPTKNIYLVLFEMSCTFFTSRTHAKQSTNYSMRVKYHYGILVTPQYPQ